MKYKWEMGAIKKKITKERQDGGGNKRRENCRVKIIVCYPIEERSTSMGKICRIKYTVNNVTVNTNDSSQVSVLFERENKNLSGPIFDN